MRLDTKLKNLKVPTKKVDVVLDTDTFNEIDDQYAIAYLLRSKDKLNTKAIYAAPFSFSDDPDEPKRGMENSYTEILKILDFMGEKADVFKGSYTYLPDEKTYVDSPAARDLASRAMNYTSENPLYVVSIGAITNVASAILINPEIAERIVVVWLGGDARHYKDNVDKKYIRWEEFNLRQDVAAARVVMSSGAPFVSLPCKGVVSSFTISQPEVEYWLIGKNPLTTYLGEITIKEAEKYAKGKPWTRTIWDVVAVAYLLNDDNRFMNSYTCKIRLPEYGSCTYGEELDDVMEYVVHINRDSLMKDLIDKLIQ